MFESEKINQEMDATSEAMNQFDESMKKQIALLLKVVLLNKSLKEDNVPCEIDQVVIYCFNLIHSIFVIFIIILLNFDDKGECCFIRVSIWVRLVLRRIRLL
jgi:hypothetical protein